MTYVVTSAHALNQVAPPALPQPTDEYSKSYQDKYNNVLRIYFNRLNSLLGQLMASSSTVVPVGDYTSKGRLQVSNPETVFFNTFQYGLESDIWESSSTSGGTAVFDSTTSSVQMSVTSTSGSQIIRQTRNVQRYIPSRVGELTFSVRLENPTAGVRRRFGLFDGADGFYFEDNGGVYSCVIINSDGGSPTVDSVPRSAWNGDRLDGTGPSGIVADPSALQIVCVEYEWYGGGQVIFNFIMNGQKITVHTFDTANQSSAPWCKTPFLPIRLELTNTTGASGTHSMWQGSNSLVLDGVTNRLGIGQNILSSLTGTTLTTANTFYPVVSIRLKSTALQGVILPSMFQAATLDNTNIFFKLIRNATLTGSAWTNMPDTNSFTQYDTTATALAGGTDLYSGFIPSTSGGTLFALDHNTDYQVGRSALGTVSDTLTLAVAATVNNKQGVGSLTWIEQR